MSEVSCRVTAFILAALEEAGHEPDEFFDEMNLPLERLRDRARSLPWSEFVRLLDRLEERLGLAGVGALGARTASAAGNRPLRAIARFAFTERQLWRLLSERSAPSFYPGIDFEHEVLADGRIRLRSTIPSDAEPSEAFAHFFMGGVRAIPALLGDSREVELELDAGPRVATAVLRPTADTRFWRRGARALAGRAFGKLAFEELERRHRRAAETMAELEARDRMLAALRDVTDAIVQSVDFTNTAQRIVDAICDNTDFAAANLYRVDPAGEELELIALHAPDERFTMPSRVPLVGRRGAAVAMTEGRVVWASDPSGFDILNPEVRTAMVEAGLHSFALIPLIYGGEVLGTLGVARRSEHDFSRPERSSLETLGKTAAAALVSARHVMQIEQEIEVRTLAEERARESEARLREVAENVDAVTYLVDLERSAMLYLSPNFERITGHPAEVLGGDRNGLLALVAPADQHRVRDRWAELEGSEAATVEFRIVRPDGGTIDVVDRLRRVPGIPGHPARAAGVLQDVTAMRALEQQLRAAQKVEAVGRLAGGIAHDFNNLLTVIMAGADSLRESVGRDGWAQATADDVVEASESAARLTRRLLTLARQQPVRIESLDVVEVMEGMSSMLRSLMGEQIEFEIIVPPESAAGDFLIDIDRGQLEQVLLNLAVNARDAMGTSGRVAFEVGTSKPDRVTLCVEDEGPGMSPEIRLNAFDPFFTTKPESDHSGLGLAIVLGIVEQAGASIEIDSEVGRGTRFTIEWPASRLRRPAGPKQLATGAAMENRERILVVEDKPDLRRILKLSLEQAGFQVSLAEDGEAALAALATADGEIRLVVTDVVMPGIGGIELAERIARTAPEIRVVFMSGYAGPGDDEGFGSRGEVVIAKPFRPAELVALVRAQFDEIDARDE